MKVNNSQEHWSALAGIVLFVALFLPWFGYSALNIVGSSFDINETVNAFQSFQYIDSFLIVTALAAVAVMLVKLMESVSLQTIFAANALTAMLGFVAAGLIVYRAFEPIVDGASLEYGLWIGLVGAVGITVSAYVSSVTVGKRIQAESEVAAVRPSTSEPQDQA